MGGTPAQQPYRPHVQPQVSNQQAYQPSGLADQAYQDLVQQAYQPFLSVHQAYEPSGSVQAAYQPSGLLQTEVRGGVSEATSRKLPKTLGVLLIVSKGLIRN